MQIYLDSIDYITNTHTVKSLDKTILGKTTALFYFIGTYGITVAGGVDVRQGSIWDYRDTVTGPRADTANVCILHRYCTSGELYCTHKCYCNTEPRVIPAQKSPSLLEVLNVSESFLQIQTIISVICFRTFI